MDSHSLFAANEDPILKYRWNIKPDPDLQLKQELSLPDFSVKSEQMASTSDHNQQYQDDKTTISTQHQEYKADISMSSAKEYIGLSFLPFQFLHCEK